MIPALAHALARGPRGPVITDAGARVGAAALEDDSARVGAALLDGRADLEGARVAVLVEPGRAWLSATLGVMRAGGAAVPLGLALPEPELAHALDEAQVSRVIASPALAPRVRALAASRGLAVDDAATLAGAPRRALPVVDDERGALVLFTSGTTGKPKAAVLSHRALDAQIRVLLAAWRWRPTDHVSAFLPLHHVHGIVNVVFCGLAAGATVHFRSGFDPAAVCAAAARGELTVLMAVPTIWRRLLDHVAALDDDARGRTRDALAALRLAVSGSAALDGPLFHRIVDELGLVPLERYGMTEIGMALSNPYRGARIAKTVGFPLPGVLARVVDDDGVVLAGGHDAAGPAIEGELQVRGPSLFSGYLGRPEATRAAFTDDGWFRTGDVVRRQGGRYAILGRRSSDILKTGGEKVSALEIESALAAHPAIAAVAVVGVPDDEWGQRVTAVVELRPGTRLGLDELRAFAKDHLAPYKVPRALHVMPLPRNALGKVQKSIILRALEGSK